MKENMLLHEKADRLEKLENAIHFKYVLKADTDKHISRIENELIILKRKIDEYHDNLESEKKEKFNLKIMNAELQKAIEEQEKRIENYYSRTISKRMTTEENRDHRDNLDLLISAESESDDDEEKVLGKRIITKLNKGEKSPTKDEYETGSEDAKILSKLMKMETIVEDNNKTNIQLSQIDLKTGTRYMDRNDKKTQVIKFDQQPKFVKNQRTMTARNTFRSTILKDHDDNSFKDFFKLTFQAMKLNSENIEPFLIVNNVNLVKYR
jgi:chromosome segregation ATPase